MIKSYKPNVTQRKRCFNCNRDMLGTIEIEVTLLPFLLCEDCVNALSNVIRKSLSDESINIYDKDEYFTLKE